MPPSCRPRLRPAEPWVRRETCRRHACRLGGDSGEVRAPPASCIKRSRVAAREQSPIQQHGSGRRYTTAADGAGTHGKRGGWFVQSLGSRAGRGPFSGRKRACGPQLPQRPRRAAGHLKGRNGVEDPRSGLTRCTTGRFADRGPTDHHLRTSARLQENRWRPECSRAFHCLFAINRDRPRTARAHAESLPGATSLVYRNPARPCGYPGG